MIFNEGGRIFLAPANGRIVEVHPLLIYTVILVGFVLTNLALAQFAGPRKRTPVKEMPYESGMDPMGDARQPFDVKFYLIAIMFLVFDMELLFLFPWAVSAYVEGGIPAALRGTVFVVMLLFMAKLGIAYVYDWRKGVFRWR
jgi:NADH-quinone oxidoreductase subunit A